MLFAMLFIIAFLVGLIVYHFTRDWKTAVVLPIVLFVLNTLTDQQASEAWSFTLIFGIPIVFFASLLGAYVVQIRTIEPDPPLNPEELETEDPQREDDRPG